VELDARVSCGPTSTTYTFSTDGVLRHSGAVRHWAPVNVAALSGKGYERVPEWVS
jgi:hypothetical protein